MLLYIVRHAWAGDSDDPEYPDDRLRPLTSEGRTRFARVIRKLVKRDFHPAVIATSPLARCRQTADVIAERVPGHPPVIELPALAPGSDLAELVAWSAEHAAAGDLAWVGHAPDVSELTAALVGDGRAQIRFPKGGIAALGCDGSPRPGEAVLVWLATAKLLGC